MFRRNNTAIIAKTIIVLSVTLTFLITAGCAPPAKELNNINKLADPVSTSYPLIIKDDSGADVIIDNKPQKIVSLLPSSTETLFALGQEANIIAVSKWDNYPENLKSANYYRFEDLLNPNLEKLIDLKPDLVLIGAVSGDTLRKMRSLQLPIVVLNAQNIEKTYETIRKIGNITDSQAASTTLIDKMQEKEHKIKETVAQIADEQKPSVWIEVSSDLLSPGRNTLLHELITKAGGKNINSDFEGWMQVDPQQIVTKNPQVIFYTYAQPENNVPDIIKSRPDWQDIDAVKNSRIIELDNNMISRPGPRIIEGLELIAKSLYPDKF